VGKYASTRDVDEAPRLDVSSNTPGAVHLSGRVGFRSDDRRPGGFGERPLSVPLVSASFRTWLRACFVTYGFVPGMFQCLTPCIVG
jgi:hypothetical protein